jgi:hypothetical protein
MCADETSCDWEKVTLCAFQYSNSTDIRLKYLDCMDSNKLPLFYDPSIPRECSNQIGVDFDAVSTCFEGKEGDQLLKQGMNATVQHVGKGSFTLPTVMVNKKIVCTSTKCNYQVIAQQLNGNDRAADSGDENAFRNDNNDNTPVSITYYFASK